jgi:hypothetical protein
MRLKTACLLVAVVLILTIPAYAEQTRGISVNTDLSFSNYVAACSVDIYAESLTDSISVTMELWRGGTKISDWSTTGTWHVTMSETANVTRYRTYTLVVNYSINGVAKTPVSIDRYYG